MSRAKWERLVGRWRRSGLTSREFAARAGVNRGTLTYWAWRLKRESVGQADSGAGEAAGPLPVIELAAEIGESRFELELPDCRVLVPRDFDDGELRRLLAVVETRR